MDKINQKLILGGLFFVIGEGLYFLNIWNEESSNKANLILSLSFCYLMAALFIFTKYAYENRLSDNSPFLKD